MRIQRDNKPARLGIVGKVKVGKMATSKSGTSYPASLDYFRFTSDQQHRLERMQQLFGEKPSKLPITFHSNNPDEVCIERYELRDKGGRLVAYGDGRIFYRSTAKGYLREDARQYGVDKYMSGLARKVGGEWKEVVLLRFLVVGFTELGLWEFRTSGKDTSIPLIVGTFDTVLNAAGRVQMIPFSLTVSKKKSNRAEVTRQYPVVSLICDLDVQSVDKLKAYGDSISGFLTEEKVRNFEPPMELPEAEEVITDAEIVEG